MSGRRAHLSSKTEAYAILQISGYKAIYLWFNMNIPWYLLQGLS